AEVQPFRGLLLGLFFISMGMSVNLGHFPDHTLELAASVMALLAIKFITLFPLSRLFGIGSKDSVSVSLLLAQGGEFALVLFALAKGLGLLDETLFQYLLIVVILSMLVTPLLDKLAHVIYIKSRIDSKSCPNDEIDKIEQTASPVILAGFGRMGRRIASILELMEVSYVAIDKDTFVVEREHSAGKTVNYGDATHPEVLRAAGAADARIVIVSIDDFEATERVVSTLHTSFPNVPVFVRGHSLSKCRQLEALGACYTVSETLEAGVELARAALLYMGANEPDVSVVLESFRRDCYGRTDQKSHK
ncbi:MAG TPA: potassium transporter KefC, partial [Gammaproteobacteria bacterium]|nr:potassium transporter KefC [Gammaproteobacteria bacterium]